MSGAFRENCFKMLCTKTAFYAQYRADYPTRLSALLRERPELIPTELRSLTLLDLDLIAASSPQVSLCLFAVAVAVVVVICLYKYVY